MHVDAVTPRIYTGLKAVRILPEENASRKYLYNEILDITRKIQVPANFHTNKIELPEPITVVIEKLKELGICYTEIK